MTTAIATPTTAQKTDFADLVNLLSLFTQTRNAIDALENDLNAEHLEVVRTYSEEYKKFQTQLGECEAGLQVIAERNPQWFEKAKTVETPFGEVKRTTSISLEIPNEPATVALIRAAGQAEAFLDVSVVIRKEVLEALSDDELAKLGVRRVTKHNFKPGAATVDLGKAVKAADKTDRTAAKAAKKAAVA